MLADVVWAKSSANGGLSLVRHMLDAAAVAWELLETKPAAWGRSAAHLSINPDDCRAWLSFLVGCHDLGKATPGFQQKWPPGKERDELHGLVFPAGAPDRHDASTGFYLKRILVSLGLLPRDATLLADAVAAHHGFIIDPSETRQVGMFDRALSTTWQQTIDDAAGALRTTLGLDAPPRLSREVAERSEIAIWLAGFCAVCDWLASNVVYFPPDRKREDLAAWWITSRRLARVALDDAGLLPNALEGPLAASACLEAGLAPGLLPRPLQSTLADLLPNLHDAPSLLVIEAPMGEGKTETAFVADAWFRANGGLLGTYFAMPTQATSNALFGRLAEYLGRISKARVQIQLAHGAARHADTVARLAEIGFGSADGTVTAATWLAGARRTLLCPYAVGTVDQALVGVLNAKHHFVRLFGLADRLVVFDEVHAYDSYTGGLIERLIAWLHQQHCSVIVMSATLPDERRRALVSAFGVPPGAEIPETPYPRMTLANSTTVCVKHVAPSRRFEVAVETLASEPEAVAESALRAVAAGARVLVVVNKVARAQTLHTLLKNQGADSTLFHARFPMQRRLEIEREVLARFGRDGSASAGCVLVATQVAEQSLDVDFDLLISDLAPLDLLLQRVGRVHRHARPRPPAFSQPTMRICGLAESEIPPRMLTDHVYDLATVLRSALYLRRHPVVPMPEGIDRAVQWVYGAEVPDFPSPSFAAMYGEAERRLIETLAEQRRLAAMAALPPPADWPSGNPAVALDDDAAAEGGERFGTRLGQRSLSVIPVIRLGTHYSVLGDSPDWAVDARVPFQAALSLAQRFLRISQPQLVAALCRGPALPGWSDHAALAGHLPLVLDHARSCQLAGTRLTLDAELGLIIERQLQ